MEQKKIISDNAVGTDSSFVGILHEQGVWDTQAFWHLYDALNELAANPRLEQIIERELATQISKINAFILNSVIHHLDKDDSFKIQNLDPHTIRDYLERLNLVVSGFFQGKPIKEDTFDDDLRKSEDPN